MLFYGIFFLGFSLTCIALLLPKIAYTRQLKLAGVCILFVGVYLSGYAFCNDTWKAKAAALEARAAAVESEAKTANTVIQEKLVTKIQVVRERGRDVVEYVDREVVKYNDRCDIPREVVSAHNQAAGGTKK